MTEKPMFPVRECKSCGWKTTSTSTLDFCIKCKDADGLRPRWRDDADERRSPHDRGTP